MDLELLKDIRDLQNHLIGLCGRTHAACKAVENLHIEVHETLHAANALKEKVEEADDTYELAPAPVKKKFKKGKK